MLEQLSIFDCYPKEEFNVKKIRLIELFAGIGSQAAALERLGVNFEHYRVVEFDKYPVKSYNAIYGTNFEPTDITKISGDDLGIVDTANFTYLLTYSFPCQDLSVAGKQKGMSKGTGTRSGLLWEVERLLNECEELPQVLLMENVPQVHSKKNMPDFEKWQEFLRNKGYHNFWQDLNAKNYGVAQNRNRCFMISLLQDIHYSFPKPIPLTKKLKDYLEDEVDKKYYLSEKMLNYCLGVNQDTGHFPRGERFLANINRCNQDVANTISTNSGQRPVDNFIKIKNGEITQEPFLKIKEATKKGYNEAYDGDSINLERINSKTRRGRVGKEIAQTILTQCEQGVVVNDIKVLGNYNPSGHDASRIVDISGIAPTVKENHGTVTAVAIKEDIQLLGGIGQKKSNGGKQWYQQDRIYSDNMAISVTTAFNPYYQTDLKIRKLTPKECWRLMGFTDEEFEKAAAVNSNTQLYKQAGNSIVVDVLVAIFKELLF